ncbi:MAG: thiamine pyrophosphate-dependent enzyme [Candidatus Lernaella stagnicola]|nr:thiamine pyrophosphate-dependent enzyme [Candidatus Lernaella stagnicola]
MPRLEDYELHEPQWCPGCGNFDLLDCLKSALVDLGIEPRELMLATGIGQASKLGFSLKANMFDGLHGRMMPLALGMKMANHQAKVLVISGDGCFYSEGGNHFIHNIRRNLDVTMIASDNRVFGLTKGQASPTAAADYVTKIHNEGVGATELRPSALALVCGATFVAKTFTGYREQLVELLKAGIMHKGAALIDVMSPCVSFNKVNSFAWYKQHSGFIPEGHDAGDLDAALQLAMHGLPDGRIPTGLYYQVERPVFGANRKALQGEPIVTQTLTRKPERAAELFARFR